MKDNQFDDLFVVLDKALNNLAKTSVILVNQGNRLANFLENQINAEKKESFSYINKIHKFKILSVQFVLFAKKLNTKLRESNIECQHRNNENLKTDDSLPMPESLFYKERPEKNVSPCETEIFYDALSDFSFHSNRSSRYNTANDQSFKNENHKLIEEETSKSSIILKKRRKDLPPKPNNSSIIEFSKKCNWQRLD